DGLQGFAYEGASMAMALLDLLQPWGRRRWRVFADGPGAPHVYVVHVGLGWAVARVPWRFDAIRAWGDPFLHWLGLDGVGFHEGFFHGDRYRAGARYPRGIAGYGTRAFDQGLGRSLWFSEAGDVDRILSTIRSFGHHRHADLWSGVG